MLYFPYLLGGEGYGDLMQERSSALPHLEDLKGTQKCGHYGGKIRAVCLWGEVHDALLVFSCSCHSKGCQGAHAPGNTLPVGLQPPCSEL